MSKAIVIGMARSGVAAANLLVHRGWEVVITDLKDGAELERYVSALAPGVRLVLGGHPEGVMDGADLVVVSPGVPMAALPVKHAHDRGIEVIGEIELAWRYFNEGLDYYAVTGTNGKSTTVTLLHRMLMAAGRQSLLGGNIGTPLCSALEGDEQYDCVVAELSSFQLETINDFRPRVAAILNVTPDHMDRYESLEHYRDAKLRVVMNQAAGDYLVLNADDPMLSEVEGCKGDVHYFSRSGRVSGVYLSGDTVCYELLDGRAGELIAASEIRIKGVHNLENAMAASLMALLVGCPADAVRSALREFEGLEHRLEHVRDLDGVAYINDSKGTNVGAVQKSMESFDMPVVLIAGGRDKEGDFQKLTGPLAARARALVLIGEAAAKIEDAVGAEVKCHRAGDMDEAVSKARALASPGDVVLLSPACASFDMFTDFEHRGREFKRAVMAL